MVLVAWHTDVPDPKSQKAFTDIPANISGLWTETCKKVRECSFSASRAEEPNQYFVPSSQEVTRVQVSPTSGYNATQPRLRRRCHGLGSMQSERVVPPVSRRAEQPKTVGADAHLFKSPTRVALGGAFVLVATFVVTSLRQIIPVLKLPCQVRIRRCSDPKLWQVYHATPSCGKLTQ